MERFCNIIVSVLLGYFASHLFNFVERERITVIVTKKKDEEEEDLLGMYDDNNLWGLHFKYQ